jgi:hypothetical protein
LSFVATREFEDADAERRLRGLAKHHYGPIGLADAELTAALAACNQLRATGLSLHSSRVRHGGTSDQHTRVVTPTTPCGRQGWHAEVDRGAGLHSAGLVAFVAQEPQRQLQAVKLA